MKIDARKQKDGYNKIFDAISQSKNMKELQKAVESSLPIIQEYQLDEYQVQKLEERGMKKYNSFLLADMMATREMQSNRFRS
jgi:hypothetical protein